MAGDAVYGHFFERGPQRRPLHTRVHVGVYSEYYLAEILIDMTQVITISHFNTRASSWQMATHTKKKSERSGAHSTTQRSKKRHATPQKKPFPIFFGKEFTTL